MKDRVSSLLALLMLILVTTMASAQSTGTIRGTITDRSDRGALLGANVMIEGTSRGTATDLEGNYIIRSVPAGTYTLVASYLGYQSERMEITLVAGQELVVNFQLAWSGLSGDDIIITAQARGQFSAINEQLSSRTIKNIVSSERIRELPDENAATALSRLPGVSLQDGDKVVIRGIQAKLNVVTVNGIQLPSTDMNDRSTNLGFISSNMLDGVEVTKAVTPDMDANSIGGTVNLRLREAPEGLRIEGLTQGGYNTQDRTNPFENYQVWGSVSNRFFNNKFGVFLQGNAKRSDGGGDIAAVNFARMGPGSDLPYGQATYGMQEFQFIDEIRVISEYGGSLIMDYRYPTGKIVVQNTIANTTSDLARQRDILFMQSTARQYRLTRDVHDKQLLINSLQGDQSIGKLQINYGVSRAQSTKVTDIRYGDPGENFGFANNTRPPYPFTPFSPEQLRFLTFDQVYDLSYDPDDWSKSVIFQFAGTRDEDFDQLATAANIDFTYPMNIANFLDIELKAGGKISRSVRENDTERTYVRVVEPGNNDCAAEWMIANGINPNQQLQFVDFRDYDYGRGDYFLKGKRPMNFITSTSRMDRFIRLASPCWPNHGADSRRDDFKGTETVSAAYAMGHFDIGKRLSITAGVRFERFDMDYKSNFVFQTHGVDGSAIIVNEIEATDPIAARRKAIADSLTNVQRTIDNFFPNLQARYQFTDWLDVRFAYTKTLSRPDFIALIPNVFRATSASGDGGNPYLNPTISNSYDLNMSLYANKIGLFTFGGFYKKLDNVFFGVNRLMRALPEGVNFPSNAIFTELGLTPMANSAVINTFMNNPNPAYIKGFEIDWQTNFWYLPKPFNSIVLNANYTRVFSEMDYQQIRIVETVQIIDRRPVITYNEVDTVRKARLLHQGDHIINLAMGADYKGFSGRISFRLQGDVITSVGARPEEDTFAENIYSWDFTLRQNLPIDGLSVTLSGVNIFHSPQKSYRYFRRDVSESSPSNILSDVRYYPRRFELALRYTF